MKTTLLDESIHLSVCIAEYRTERRGDPDCYIVPASAQRLHNLILIRDAGRIFY